MKKCIFSIFLISGLNVAADVYRVNDLSGGINDSVPSDQIADNEEASIINFHVNPISHGLDQRRGSSKQNSTQLSGSSAVDIFNHVTSLGNSYLISIASKTVSYSTSNGATWTTLISSATLNAVWDGTSYVDDNFYMVNQNDGGWYFTGTGLLAAGSMPAGKYIEAYQNRLFVANTASFPYRVFFSGLLQPSTFTTSTDYFDMPEAVTCIGKPFDGGLPIYTQNTTWMLRGTAPTNFDLQQISGQVGCVENRDVQNFEIAGVEYQVFFSLGPNSSKKSLYALLGNRIIDLGRKIPNLMDGVAVFDNSARTQEWDTDIDFSFGTNANTYESSTEEAVKLSTSSDIDTSSSDFVAGTLGTGLSTAVTNGQLTFSTLLNPSAENGTVNSNPTGWSVADINGFLWGTSTTTVRTGSRSFAPTISGHTYQACNTLANTLVGIAVVDSSSNTLVSTSLVTPSTVSWTQRTLSMSGYSGQLVKVKLNYSNSIFEYSNQFLSDGGNITYYDYASTADCAGVTPAGQYVPRIEDFAGGVVLATSTFTSAAFDTTFSTAAMFASGANWTANGSSIQAQTQESSDGSSWDAAVTWSTGSAPSSSARKRYKRYVLNFSTTSSSTAMPYVDDVTLNARAATGTYTSDVRNGGQSISSWDIFSTNVSGGGTHSYSYRTAADTTTLAATAYTGISSGGDIAGSAQYIQFQDSFTVNQSTNDPTLNSVLINYTKSSGASQPGDMVVWNNNLWMTYTSTSGSYNDSIVMMNDEGKYSKFTGLNVYGFATLNSRLLAGTSLTDGINGGYVRQLDIGTTDDGTAVSASVVFKAQEFTPWQDYQKNINLVYFQYGADAGTFTANLSENFGETSTDYTVNFNAGTTVARWKLEASPSTVCKQLGLSLSNSYAGSRLLLYPPITYHISQSELIAQP